MQSRQPLVRASETLRAWLGPALLGALALIAYRTLWLGAPAAGQDVERLLFRPSTLPGVFVLGVAGWLLWRRRDRLRALPEQSTPLLAIALAALGTALFVWAQLTRTGDLLLASLAANTLAFAAATRGRVGCRAALLPALVLLLGVGLPRPIGAELVWHLQLWTAEGAGWLLDALGRDIARGGVILHNEEHAFQVIESCSGMRGIQILTLVALIVRELFADAGVGGGGESRQRRAGRRQWLLVALAPPLGMALNVVRVAYVAADPQPEALAGIEADHTPQGLAVLTAGTAILYALGWALAPAQPADGANPASPPRPAGTLAWSVAVGWLALLAVLTWTLPSFSTGASRLRPSFPAAGSGWTSQSVQGDTLFTGNLFSGMHRRYELEEAAREPEVVELLISYEDATDPTSTRLLTSRLAVPGPEWNLVRVRREPLWQLGHDADMAVLSRGAEHAVVYTWRLRDRGLWRESWRSLLALESSPFRREERRTAVRLVAYARHGGQLLLDRAKQRLDRFTVAFREELSAL